MGYCNSFEGNLVTWKSKKQNVVAQLQHFLQQLALSLPTSIPLSCDSQAA